ncbi:MAG: aldo/keto reductase [Anaerolineales bacterium]|nr:aldo/keto reductase [Anaerolineales bacterium]
MTEGNGNQKRRLGQTDLEVTPIGLGVMQFSGAGGVFGMMFPDLSQEQMDAIVKAALDGGINWFDTAEMYGRGRSERGLANGLKAAAVEDEDVVVATKWFPIFRTAGNIPRSIYERIRFLDGYSIDLYMVHQPWGFSSPEVEMDVMADLVEAGKIRSVGVSNFNIERMRRAHATLERRGLPLAVNQVQYSLLHRKVETNGVLEAAKDLGVTIVAWSPLAMGILSGKFHKHPELIDQAPFARRMMLRRSIERSRPLIETLENVAANYDATPAQVALNWLVNFQGETVVAIPGASGVNQAEDSAGAMRFKLSDQDMARLDESSRAFR